jgi:hypothetical protein
MNGGLGNDGASQESLSPGPKSRICYICGRPYGTNSYEIHLKQCKELWIAREAQKDPKERKKLPEDPFANGGGNFCTPSKGSPNKGGGNEGEGGTGGMSLEEMNKIAGATFNSESLEQCKWCSRSFLPEKLLIHNKSCTQENPARKANDGVRKGNAPIQLSQEYTPGAVMKRPVSQARFKRPASTNNSTDNLHAEINGQLFPLEDVSGGTGIASAPSPGGENDPTNLRVSHGNLVGSLGGASGRALRKASAPKPGDGNVFGMPQDLNNKEEVFNYLNSKMKNLEVTAETILSELAEIKNFMATLQAQK